LPEVANGGRNKAEETPAKHWLMQAAIKMHLSQPIGTGVFDGQHGMSLAIASALADIDISSAIAGMDISSAVADVDISSAVADIDTSEGVPAIACRDSGASTSPAITEIASTRAISRRKVITQHHTGSRSLEEASLHIFANEDSDRQKRPKNDVLISASPESNRRGLLEATLMQAATRLRGAR
jgi:hypothetical protein